MENIHRKSIDNFLIGIYNKNIQIKDKLRTLKIKYEKANLGDHKGKSRAKKHQTKKRRP